MLIEADSQGALISQLPATANQAVYSKYFGFLQSPFTSLPNKHFFFPHESAAQVINTITFSLNSKESIVKVTGDPGVGKSYLVRQVLSSLSDEFYTINITAPNLSANVFLKYLVEELGAAYPAEANNAQLLKYIQYLLYEHYAKTDYRIVIWIDDAQKLLDETLDVIAALSKLETGHRCLLQFVLSGSKVFDETLSKASMRSLRERITFSAELSGLKFSEMQSYVEERLRISGAKDPECFSRSAISALYKKTEGIPSKVNKLSHKGLMLAFGKGAQKVEKAHIIKAAQEDEKNLTLKEMLPYLMFLVPLGLALLGVFVAIYLEWLSL